MLATIALAGAVALADGTVLEPAIVEQSETYYDVSGANEKQLIRAMERLSPHKPYPAYTVWRVFWVYHSILGADGKCRVAIAQSKVQATVTMPRWTDSAWASDELRFWWSRRLREFRQHEQDHVQQGIAAADAVQRALLTLPAAGSCDTLKTDVQRAAQAIVADAEEKDRSLDFRTAHGIAGPVGRK